MKKDHKKKYCSNCGNELKLFASGVIGAEMVKQDFFYPCPRCFEDVLKETPNLVIAIELK